jgi:hypothetical protein
MSVQQRADNGFRCENLAGLYRWYKFYISVSMHAYSNVTKDCLDQISTVVVHTTEKN